VWFLAEAKLRYIYTKITFVTIQTQFKNSRKKIFQIRNLIEMPLSRQGLYDNINNTDQLTAKINKTYCKQKEKWKFAAAAKSITKHKVSELNAAKLGGKRIVRSTGKIKSVCLSKYVFCFGEQKRVRGRKK
jgi:hypothetical protein